MRRVGVVGLFIGAFLVLSIVRANGGDPVVFLAIGPESPSAEFTEDLVGRDVETRYKTGHDGRFFFVQALDPLYLGTTENAEHLDLQLYRGQRMFYPLLAGLGGLAPPTAIPWLMGVVQIVAYGIGTAATARLAEQQGGSPWWGLAFGLNIGLLMVLLIGGAGVVALACAMAGTAMLGEGRIRSAAFFLALSVLSREVMLLYVAGVVFFEWQRGRRPPWVLAAVPGLSFTAWYAYILVRLDGTALFESNNALGLPFGGIIAAAPGWTDDPQKLITASVSMVAGVLIVRSAMRRPSPLVAGAVGFVGLSVLLSDAVWNNAFDLSRALAPVYTALIVSVFARPRQDALVPTVSRGGLGVGGERAAV